MSYGPWKTENLSILEASGITAKIAVMPEAFGMDQTGTFWALVYLQWGQMPFMTKE